MRVWGQALVPRPFLRTREEFEIRGARERVWQIVLRATVGMLARLEWNAVTLHPAYSVIQCSSHVTEKANPGGVVRNSLNSYECRKQRRNVEKKTSYEASTER